MADPKFEIPADWGDPLAELREQCRQYDGIEDEEDRLIREGEASYKAMSPEARAALDSHFDDLVAKMQQPGAMEAVHAVFSRGNPAS